MSSPAIKRRTFRLVTAWIKDVPDESPWLLEAYDEIAEDNWNGVPDYFTEALEKHAGSEIRIVHINIDYGDVLAQFEQADIDGDVDSGRSVEAE